MERVGWQTPLWISTGLFVLGSLPIRLAMISRSRSVQRSNCRVRTGRQKTLKSSRPTRTWRQARDNSAASDVAGRGTLNPPPQKWVLQETHHVSNTANMVQKVTPPTPPPPQITCTQNDTEKSASDPGSPPQNTTTRTPQTSPKISPEALKSAEVKNPPLTITICNYSAIPPTWCMKENWLTGKAVWRNAAYLLTWDPCDGHSGQYSILTPPGGGAHSHPSTCWVKAEGASAMQPWARGETLNLLRSVAHPLLPRHKLINEGSDWWWHVFLFYR